MTTSSRVKALLELTSTDQSTFAAAFGMTTPQAHEQQAAQGQLVGKRPRQGCRPLRRKAGIHPPGWLPAYPRPGREVTATPQNTPR